MTEKERHSSHFTYAEFLIFKELMEARFISVEKAIEIANIEMNRRLEGMNEFREQLRSQASLFQTKAEYDLYKERIEKDIRELMRFRNEFFGRESQQKYEIGKTIAYTSLAVGFVGIIIGIILRLFKV